MQFLFQNNEEKDDVTEHHRAMRIYVILQVLAGKTPIQMVNMYEDAQIVKSYPCICVSMAYPVNFIQMVKDVNGKQPVNPGISE